MNKISIIVPIYKIEEKFLRKCIESIIGQTLKDIEIILVDDESPDNCGKICDEYAEKDSRIKVIHQKNKGLSGARNTGFNQATGEWITFVDGDDWIEKEMCEKLYNIAISKDLDVVCSAVLKDYGTKTYKYDYSKFEEEKKYIKDECKYWQKEILDYNAHISGVYAKIIRRKLLVDNNILHDEQLRQGAEGIEFNLRLFEKVQSVYLIKEYFYHYMYNPNSISASHDEKNHIYVLNCFEKIKKYILNSENKKELLPMFYNRMIYVIITTAISGYFNLSNLENYSTKKQKFKEYMKNNLIQETLKKANLEELDIERRIILFLIKIRCYFIINILGIIRRKQKNKKR